MIIQGTAIKGMTVSSSAATVEPDSYFNLVSLLLPGNGTNGAQNNTFLDSSTNNFTVTRNGNPTQGTFSPFSQTGWSGYFDGTDSLTIPTGAFSYTSGTAFTFECWVYRSSTTGSSSLAQIVVGTVNGGQALSVYVTNTGQAIYGQANVTDIIASSTGVISLDQWYHIAISKNASNTVRMWVNGTSVGTTTDSRNYAVSSMYIGRNQNNTQNLDGYVSNLRSVVGSSVYDPTQTTITVPTSPLTAISGTSLLTCQSNRFIDNSSNAFAITVNGNTAVQAFAPFNPTTAYAAGTVGGSGYFDGNGDYLTVADNTAFEFGSGDFTIEGWFYALSVASDTTIVSKWTATGTANSNSWLLFVTSGVATFLTSTNGSAVDVNISGGTVTVNSWNHIAVSRSGNTYSLYLNGTRTATTTNSNSLADVATVVAIGRYSGGTFGYMNGYISNARIVKGTAVYTGSTYTVPTTPLTAVTNTQLLLNYTNGGITDAAAKNVLETVGGASISTAQSKWGGSAMAFDGSGDWLINPPSAQNQLGTGDFTVEFWFYSTSSADVGIFNISATSSSGSAGMAITKNTSNQITFWVNGNGGNTVTTSTYSINAWHHVALVRNGSTNTLYVDGVSAASNSNTPTWASTPCIGVGRPYNDNTIGAYIGYINDLRITRGYARYTANFTPPTSAFPTQ